MEEVSFAYESRNKVLHEIGFQAEPGSVIALAGLSGAGKSTIIGLIAAFYTPSRGRVLVDGTDLSTAKRLTLFWSPPTNPIRLTE